jgi:hypothetical protein
MTNLKDWNKTYKTLSQCFTERCIKLNLPNNRTKKRTCRCKEGRSKREPTDMASQEQGEALCANEAISIFSGEIN